MSGVFFVVLGVYIAVIMGISIWSYFRTETEVDFLAAGRSIGPIVGGAVLAATQISAGTFVGTAGRHYLAGVSWVFPWLGLWTGWLVCAFFVAPKLRRLGALTVPDYISARFGSPLAGALAGVLIVVAYTIYLVAQFQAGGEVAEVVFGIRPLTAMLIIVASTALYTLLGGVRSSSYIDFLQTMIMIAALVVAVPVLLNQVGGGDPLAAVQRSLGFLDTLDDRLVGWYYRPRELLAFAIAFGLSIAAAPYELTRFYSMRDERTVRRAIFIAIGFQVVIATSIMSIGMLTRVLFPNLPSQDQATATMALHVLPPVVGALLLVAMLSAIMSTVNSVLLVTGAGVAHDLYGKFIRPGASQKHLVNANRVAIVVLSIIPLYFALQKLGDVQGIVLEQAKFIASFFFVPIVIGLNWRGGTAKGAVAAMIGGFLACLVWTLFFQEHYFPLYGIDSVEPGVAVSLVLFIVVSKLTKPNPGQKLEVFFAEQEKARKKKH
ncbi:sodium:solute symporter family protein [Candidatus Palauibacter sp.]|uniref:sodium:solute symporter family protein n=1 Tax=Candidatus Palauibacter sp. TaxID=3101350 RepID=UPI003AF30F2C